MVSDHLQDHGAGAEGAAAAASVPAHRPETKGQESGGWTGPRGTAAAAAADSQAVDHGAAFATLPLPVVHLGQQAQEGLLGVGHVAVRRPAQELEVAHRQLALLKLKQAANGQSVASTPEDTRTRLQRPGGQASDLLPLPMLTLAALAENLQTCAGFMEAALRLTFKV